MDCLIALGHDSLNAVTPLACGDELVRPLLRSGRGTIGRTERRRRQSRPRQFFVTCGCKSSAPQPSGLGRGAGSGAWNSWNAFSASCVTVPRPQLPDRRPLGEGRRLNPHPTVPHVRGGRHFGVVGELGVLPRRPCRVSALGAPRAARR